MNAHRRTTLAILIGLATFGAQAQSTDFPHAPIKLVVGATPGGTVDTMARLLADGLAAHLKQPAVVDNRPGANGAIAADIVAKSKADGYTLYLGTSGFTTLPLLQKNLPYRQNDLQPVAIAAFTPFILFAGPTSNASSVANLVSYAKANPGKLTVASGDGTTLMASELFMAAAGINVTNVNYRGGPQMIQDIANGQVDYGFLGATAVLPMAKAGRLRMLGIASSRRIDIAPDVPTLAEQGIKGVLMEPWIGLMVPRGTDPAVVHAIEQAVNATTQTEVFMKKVHDIGSVPRFLGADASATYIANEAKSLEQVANAAGIKAAD